MNVNYMNVLKRNMRNLEDNVKSSRFFYLVIKMYLCIINMNISK